MKAKRPVEGGQLGASPQDRVEQRFFAVFPFRTLASGGIIGVTGQALPCGSFALFGSQSLHAVITACWRVLVFGVASLGWGQGTEPAAVPVEPDPATAASSPSSQSGLPISDQIAQDPKLSEVPTAAQIQAAAEQDRARSDTPDPSTLTMTLPQLPSRQLQKVWCAMRTRR